MAVGNMAKGLDLICACWVQQQRDGSGGSRERVPKLRITSRTAGPIWDQPAGKGAGRDVRSGPPSSAWQMLLSSAPCSPALAEQPSPAAHPGRNCPFLQQIWVGLKTLQTVSLKALSWKVSLPPPEPKGRDKVKGSARRTEEPSSLIPANTDMIFLPSAAWPHCSRGPAVQTAKSQTDLRAEIPLV